MNKELKEAVEQIKVEITLSELPDKLLFGIETLITFIEEYKKNILTKEEFRSILCEFPPSIAEDSQQPEWTQGEMDKVWDFTTKKNKYILTQPERELPSEREIEKIIQEVREKYNAEYYADIFAKAIHKRMMSGE